MPKDLKKKAAAEKLGYRWMMRCLKALDARQRDLERMRDVAATDDHLKIVVHHADACRYKGGWKAFKADVLPAAREALGMLHAGSLAAGCALIRPGQIEQEAATPFPDAFKVVFTLREF